MNQQQKRHAIKRINQIADDKCGKNDDYVIMNRAQIQKAMKMLKLKPIAEIRTEAKTKMLEEVSEIDLSSKWSISLDIDVDVYTQDSVAKAREYIQSLKLCTSDGRISQINKERNRLLDLIILGDADEAIALIETFEKF